MGNQTENQKPILVKIANQLLKDQQELDSLVVQLSLGKVEAKDKFEEIKSELKQKVQELKSTLSSEYQENKEWLKETISKLDELEERLTDKSKELFAENKSAILKAVETVQSELKKNPAATKLSLLFTSYSEKVKLQLEILDQNIQNKKSEISETYTEGINEARGKINTIIDRLNDKKEEADVKLEIFKEELDLVYEHLKRAVQAFK
ncbi:MAG: hypothetical protein LC109_13230 [Bacteroidia bacterium]|nr:hypothetical protein [Bacteroidia bacterium]